AEDGIRDGHVTGVQTCALPIWKSAGVRCPLRRPGDAGGAARARRADRVPRLRLVPKRTVDREVAMRETADFDATLARHGRGPLRSEERRVGKGCRSRWAADQ